MALFDGLAKWAEAEVEHRRKRVEASWAGVPGITISREDGRLVLSGKGIMRRWLGDVRLRFARWNSQ